MGTNNTYTDKQLLTYLHKHVVEDMQPKYTLSKPTFQCYLKRMDKDAEFENKVKSVLAEGEAAWVKLGVEAILDPDTKINVPLYNIMTRAKKSFQSYEVIELESRIERLEDGKE